MSNERQEPDAAAPENSGSTAGETADTSIPPDQTAARAELQSVLEDLDGYGER